MPARPRSHVVLVMVAAIVLAGCSDELQLTPKAFVPSASASAAKPVTTALDVTVALDREGLTADVTRIASAATGRITNRIDGAACTRNAGRTNCRAAMLSLSVMAKGDVTVTAGGDGLLTIAMPIGFRVDLSGTGTAQRRSDSATGETVIRFGFAPGLDEARRPRVASRATVSELAAVDLLDTRIELAPLVEEAFADARSALAREITAAVVRARPGEAVERAWSAIQSPMVFASPAMGKASPMAWMRARPQSLMSIGFATVGDDLVLTTRFAAQVEVGSGEPIRGEPVSPMPPGGVIATASEEGSSTLIVPVAVDLAALSRRIGDALPTGTRIRTRSEPTSPEVELEVRETRVSGAQRFIAVTVVAEVVAPPRFAGLVGNVNFVARPELDHATGMIRLAGVSFPAVFDPDAWTGSRQVPIGVEPLRSMIESVAEIPLRDAWAVDLSQNAAVDVAVASDLRLEAHFDHIRPVGAIATGRGLDVLVALDGRVGLRYRPQGMTSAASAGTADLVRRIREVADR